LGFDEFFGVEQQGGVLLGRPRGWTYGRPDNQELYAKVWTSGVWECGAPLHQQQPWRPERPRRAVRSGDVHMVWQQEVEFGVDLNLSPTAKLIRSATSGLGFSDFALTYGPAGNMVVLWQEMTEKRVGRPRLGVRPDLGHVEPRHPPVNDAPSLAFFCAGLGRRRKFDRGLQLGRCREDQHGRG
jgi:hypothetical protein